MRKYKARAKERATQVHIEYTVPVRYWQILHQRLCENASIIHQNVYMSKCFQDSIHHCPHLLLISNVGLDIQGIAPGTLYRLKYRPGLIAARYISDCNIGSLARERFRNPASNATCSPRDNGCPAS